MTPWEHGGQTTIDNLAMCRIHHRQIHFTEWVCRIRDGLPEFIPPPWVDPAATTPTKTCAVRHQRLITRHGGRGTPLD